MCTSSTEWCRQGLWGSGSGDSGSTTREGQAGETGYISLGPDVPGGSGESSDCHLSCVKNDLPSVWFLILLQQNPNTVLSMPQWKS